jgi:hypothetical protein
MIINYEIILKKYIPKMNIPEELNYIIISFIYSEPQLNLVCKEFNDNVSVFKKAAKVISL